MTTSTVSSGVTPIAAQLIRALREKKLSISEAATHAEVDRSFLSRLIGGQTPPRARRGRLTASSDERYRRLVDSLGLDESFIGEVEALQQATPTAPAPELQRLAGNFWEHIADDVPQEDKPDVSGLVTNFAVAAASSGQVETLGKYIMAQLAKNARGRAHRAISGAYSSNYTGAGGWSYDGTLRADAEPNEPRRYVPASEAPASPDAERATRLLNWIGNTLISYENGEVPVDVRAEIAGLFFLLATRDRSTWPEAIKLARKARGLR